MIKGYVSEKGRLESIDAPLSQLENIVWFDLLNPTDEEEEALEAALGINIPTKEDMEEIEVSSRLYYVDSDAFLTATLPSQADADNPHMAPVTFVLSGPRLITVRYHDPRAFTTFANRAEKVSMGCISGETVLIALLEVIVDRLADILERAARDIDRISGDIFQHHQAKPAKGQDFRVLLREIGIKGDLTSKIRDSLVTLERLIGFLGHVETQRKGAKEIRERIKTQARDTRSLADHASFMSQKITFLLDATLGMINIEQNAIIKIFSVAAVVFLPPTLIASIYGMNFQFMPELAWPFGYPFALALMILSAILPYRYFKYRKWL